MEAPKIKHVLDDDSTGMRFIVLAYRELTWREVLRVVRVYLSNTKGRKKPGTSITITTVIR